MSIKLALLIGAGFELVYFAAAGAFPDAPQYIWEWFFWIGIVLIVIPCVFWGFSWIENKKDTVRSDETITAFEALQMLTEVRPNSYETNAINLADSTRLGKVRTWGRPRPKMAIPDHITAVEPIPPDIWAYAIIDASLIHGPIPQSNMKYRQQFVRPYIEDDRTLYDAVYFNKKEVVELCHAENTSPSKKPAS